MLDSRHQDYRWVRLPGGRRALPSIHSGSTDRVLTLSVLLLTLLCFTLRNYTSPTWYSLPASSP